LLLKRYYFEEDESMDSTAVLAENIITTSYKKIPEAAIESTKKDILDTLGVAVAGSQAPGIKEIVRLVREWGGKREGTVIMQGMRVPCHHAALVNSTMAHALDYDDAHEGVVLHAGVVLIPPALALAERLGNINGREFITAITLGIDLVSRLGEASNIGPSELGFMYTSVYGIFGSAAATGKLLHLSTDQMVNAFGIAYSQAAGNFQCIVDGALTKRAQAGFAASDGLLSALLAKEGFTGAIDSLEGRKGLFQVYLRGDYSLTPLTRDLGKHFASVDLSFKPYPCCRNCHPFIDAALELKSEHNIRPNDIEEIAVRCSENARILCEPLPVKQKPRVVVDAQFSIPWVIATALVKGKVTLEDFTPEAISNPEVINLALKINAKVDPQLETRSTSKAVVDIKMKNNGIIYSKREDIAKGNPEKPLSWDELIEKFRDCLSYGAEKLSRPAVSRIINMVRNLENIQDVGKVIGRLA
jgi:2-methylcitrate dehydratase PrpD